MGTDLHHRCQVETRKVLWLIALVLGSVLLIQYFELPYRDTVLSLLSSGKAYFISSDGVNGDIGNRVNESSEKITSSPSTTKLGEGEDDPLLENTTHMHRTKEGETIVRSISIAPEKSSNVFGFSNENAVADTSPSGGGIDNLTALLSGQNSSIAESPKSLDVALAPVGPKRLDVFLAPMISPSESISSRKADIGHENMEKNSPPPEVKSEKQEANVVSIYEMNDLLLHSRGSSFSKSPLWPSAADQELLDARFKIEHEAIIGDRPGLYAPIYRNLSMFVRSYEIMEQKLKVYIYTEGERPVFHQPRLKGIYASEGWFMKHLKASQRFLTSDPKEAHLFYLPFSSQLLVDYVYVANSHSFDRILKYLNSYLDTIRAKHPSWNRTDGADHFVVACHDWAAYETRQVMPNCIRALCNADVKEGFKFGKDVSLPETYVHSPKNPLQETGGPPPSDRKILAFFAGQMHGKVRPILLQHWQNKDPDMKIFGRLRKGYNWNMKNSKYCICAKGYEVNSPRVVEAIIYGCVPVIISDNFVPPFFDVLNWESFAVFVLEKDIPNLKNILVSISERRYVVMQQRVTQVRQHFLWHNTPVKYDIFHMILHSVWYNRVFSLLPK